MNFENLLNENKIERLMKKQSIGLDFSEKDIETQSLILK